jgi:diacylglycerol kinase (ATP)
MVLPYGKRVHVIINPAAGQDQPLLGKLNSVFQPADVDWDVFITKKAGDGRRLAQEAVAAGVDVIAVHGGDGTVAEVVNGMIGSEIPLAIFPGGTANVLATELGIPNDPAQAASLLCCDSTLRTIDMGQIDDHYFVQRAGIGLEAQIVEGTDRETKNRLGWLAYALSAFQALSEPDSIHYSLTLDGVNVETEGLACFIANTGNVGLPGFTLAPTINISDGLLDVVVIHHTNLASLLSLAASVVSGSENLHSIQHWQIREATIDAQPLQAVMSDGEIIGETPITIKVLPQALRVIVPEAT